MPYLYKATDQIRPGMAVVTPDWDDEIGIVLGTDGSQHEVIWPDGHTTTEHESRRNIDWELKTS